MPNPEEYRRTRRIVDMVLRIANQPRCWTRRQLAEHYELSEQQMDKDVQLIRHGLRMPLRHAPDGYYFERLAVLPALSLTLPEALSLLLAARLAQQMPGISRGDLAAAIARLEALLPPRLLTLARGLSRTDDGAGSRDALLMELQLAIAEGARLRIGYRSASRRSLGADGDGPASPPAAVEREVDPYTLLPYLRSWYLVGHCHLRGEVRIFKVDRIEHLERTGERFDPPADFDVGRYMGLTSGLLRGEAGEPEEVVLEFGAEAARWVADEPWHPTQRAEPLSDGRVRLRFRAGITPELRRWVLGFGTQVRVVSPRHLAEWVREEARSIGEPTVAVMVEPDARPERKP